MESYNQQFLEKVGCPRLTSAKPPASNKNLTLPSQFCLETDRLGLPYRDQPTRIESGRANGRISYPLRIHFRCCRHHSLLAGTALLPVILVIDDSDWRLSYEARPCAAGAPDAIRPARRVAL